VFLFVHCYRFQNERKGRDKQRDESARSRGILG